MEKRSKTPTLKAFEDCLRKHNLKVTSQRLAVYEAMLSLGHACADEVASHIAKQGKVKVSVASVYNILTQMAALDLCKNRLTMGGRMVFDISTKRHIHLYNTEDGSLTDLPDEELRNKVEELFAGKRFRGYKVEGIEVNILVHPTKHRKRTLALKERAKD
ncbi:MAG: Fur family transcriptional regulator [Candidatus Cryptobacteroides sp.]